MFNWNSCAVLLCIHPFASPVCQTSLNLRVSSTHEEEQQKSIFIRCDSIQGFRLKENVQFHLYISTSPCGDARIFSPHEAGVEGTQEEL